MERKYFEVNGYYIDTPDELIEGYIFTNYDDVEENGRFSEEEIYFFGGSENNLKASIKSGQPFGDFVVTSYKVI